MIRSDLLLDKLINEVDDASLLLNSKIVTKEEDLTSSPK